MPGLQPFVKLFFPTEAEVVAEKAYLRQQKPKTETEQNKTEQNKTEQNKTEQNKTSPQAKPVSPFCDEFENSTQMCADFGNANSEFCLNPRKYPY